MAESRAETRNLPITVGDETVAPGRQKRFDLPVARLTTGTWLSLPVAVYNGRHDGPVIWLSGAIHGDEINGVAIIRRVLDQLDPRTLRGSVIGVPIVNVFGFVNQSRYLPDGRDMNRVFPGSKRGSLASRLARLFLDEVVTKCSVGIDLHTAAGPRTNLPQIRADLQDEETFRLAKSFGAPVAIHARTRDGSLREAATSRGIKVLLYEAGQIHRFDEDAIETGVAGVLRTMAALGMGSWDTPNPGDTRVIARTSWVRARRSGIADLTVEPGEWVPKQATLGTISDALGTRRAKVSAPQAGWVIARALNPLVSQGDALVHLGFEGAPGSARRSRRSEVADPRL